MKRLKVVTTMLDLVKGPPSNFPHKKENRLAFPPVGGIEGGVCLVVALTCCHRKILVITILIKRTVSNHPLNFPCQTQATSRVSGWIKAQAPQKGEKRGLKKVSGAKRSRPFSSSES